MNKKTIGLLFLILSLMLTVVGCGVKAPKERLMDAIENGEVFDMSQPLKTEATIKIDRLNVELSQDMQSPEDKEVQKVVNQLAGAEINLTIEQDLNQKMFRILADGTVMDTPFQTEVFFTPDKFVADVENMKDLIAKIEELTGEDLGIPMDQLKKYVYIDTSSSTDYQDFIKSLEGSLTNYNQTEQLSRDLSSLLFGNLDEKYYTNDGDYVKISLNNESIKEILTKILDKFEEDPQQLINDTFAKVEEIYPSIANIAESQGEQVPSKEEFMSGINQAKEEVLNQVSDPEQVKMIRNSVEQGFDMFNSLVKINKYEVGYEIQKGSVVGSSNVIDLTVKQSLMIPVALDLAVSATSHFEEAEDTITLPDLNADNSVDIESLQ